ncbi:MAG: 7TM domain-containing protein [bacterium]
MKKILFAIFALILYVTPVKAQVVPSDTPVIIASDSASTSAIVTGVIERVVEPKQDLTQPTSETKSKLERVLEENPVGSLAWNNFLRYSIDVAVKKGVPVNTVVLVLLFPLVVAMVTAARHLVGIRGVGILTPALLSVSFLATGIWVGVLLFLIILAVSTGSRYLLRKLRLQYLPRLALLLWVVSGSVFAVLLGASYLPLQGIVTVGIFPILILMLLTETFIDLQQSRSGHEAREIIFQTFVLSIATSLLLQWELLQKLVLIWPELIYFGVGLFDLFMGKYTGLRLVEYLMYRPLTQDQEEE